ncbi:MAG: hypothetical protein HC811_03640 [Flammeovirgaceae bacterium]|nr:hypothetical protein [Flammeovirgaceae bacterium]
MKGSYIYVVVFALWCWLAAQWYLTEIKHLPGDILNFNPYHSTMAIIEILVMLLVAFLIGFLAAWMSRKKLIQQLTEAVNKLVAQNSKKTNEDRSVSVAEEVHLSVREASETLKVELSKAQDEKESLELSLQRLKKNLTTIERSLKNRKPNPHY